VEEASSLTVEVNEGCEEVNRLRRVDSEGLKEGIGCMPMDGWNVSMSTIDAEVEDEVNVGSFR